MPHEVLTPTRVAELLATPGAKRTLTFDDHEDAPRGFALRCTSPGEGSFYFVKRAMGRKVWLRVGDASALSIDAARKAARAKMGDLARDVDPTAVARAERKKAAETRAAAVRDTKAPTVAELVRRYIATRQLAPRTLHEYQRTLTRDIETSALGKAKAKDVIQEDVRRFVGRLAEHGGKHQADRAFLLVRFAYKWGTTENVSRGIMLVDRDPTAGVNRPTVKQDRERRRVLVSVKATTDAEAFAEVKTFWLGTETMRPAPRAFVRLLLLLGLRRTEASLATWADVRLDGDVPSWHLAAEHRKVKLTRRDPERDSLDVPLSPLAVRILRELCELFPHGPKAPIFPHVHHATVAESMRARTGISDLALHDLRRSCATAILRLGAPPHVLTDVLGHRQRGLADSDAVYLQGRRVDEYARWLTLWSEKIEALIGDAGAAKVAKFRKRRA